MAGRDFLRTARSILEQMNSLAKSTHHVGRGEAGRLSLGFYASISARNLRATLVDFQKRSHRKFAGSSNTLPCLERRDSAAHE